ncbi:MAG: hypothetical protein CSB33_01785 [Desulfobacterales bacterium]|nr:MAG: hypothetical protein CSB33_01785 [Desulfobacterales bacterium]
MHEIIAGLPPGRPERRALSTGIRRPGDGSRMRTEAPRSRRMIRAARLTCAWAGPGIPFEGGTIEQFLL